MYGRTGCAVDRPAYFTCPICGGSKGFYSPRCTTCRTKEERISTSGYRLVRVPGSSRRQYEHRVVMEKALGRKLRSDEQVHHINKDRLDNRPENLEVLSVAEHGERHGRKFCDHERTPENTYIRPDNGGRMCAVCVRARSKRYAAERKAARHARGLLRKRRGAEG